MNTYFSSVLGTAVLSAVINLVIPNEKKTGKYIRFILGMITILTLIRPFFDLGGLPEFPDIDTSEVTADPRELIVENTEKLIEEDITNELFSRFRISKDYCAVTVNLNSDDYENITPEKILITLKSYGAWGDKSAIENYFSEKYFCTVEVLYE